MGPRNNILLLTMDERLVGEEIDSFSSRAGCNECAICRRGLRKRSHLGHVRICLLPLLTHTFFNPLALCLGWYFPTVALCIGVHDLVQFGPAVTWCTGLENGVRV